MRAKQLQLLSAWPPATGLTGRLRSPGCQERLSPRRSLRLPQAQRRPRRWTRSKEPGRRMSPSPSQPHRVWLVDGALAARRPGWLASQSRGPALAPVPAAGCRSRPGGERRRWLSPRRCPWTSGTLGRGAGAARCTTGRDGLSGGVDAASSVGVVVLRGGSIQCASMRTGTTLAASTRCSPSCSAHRPAACKTRTLLAMATVWRGLGMGQGVTVSGVRG